MCSLQHTRRADQHAVGQAGRGRRIHRQRVHRVRDWRHHHQHHGHRDGGPRHLAALHPQVRPVQKGNSARGWRRGGWRRRRHINWNLIFSTTHSLLPFPRIEQISKTDFNVKNLKAVIAMTTVWQEVHSASSFKDGLGISATLLLPYFTLLFQNPVGHVIKKVRLQRKTPVA